MFGVRVFLRLFGVRRMCLIGAGSAAVCYAALAVVPTWWLAALAMGVSGISFYMLHNSMQTEATELAPSARGSAVALFACGFFIGQGLGPLVFGALLHGLGDRLHVVGALTGGKDLLTEHRRHRERAQRDQCDDDDQDEVATGDVHDEGMDPRHVIPPASSRE